MSRFELGQRLIDARVKKVYKFLDNSHRPVEGLQFRSSSYMDQEFTNKAFPSNNRINSVATIIEPKKLK